MNRGLAATAASIRLPPASSALLDTAASDVKLPMLYGAITAARRRVREVSAIANALICLARDLYGLLKLGGRDLLGPSVNEVFGIHVRFHSKWLLRQDGHHLRAMARIFKRKATNIADR